MDKKNTIFDERQEFIDKYGTVKFTRFDPEIKAERLDQQKWPGCPPYRINILCDYINPLYERYKRLVSPGVGPMSDAQRYDFECIIILTAKADMPPDQKIKTAERQIDRIKDNPWDYLPNTAAKFRDLYPVRADGTIYEGSHKYLVKEPLPIEEYRKLFEERAKRAEGRERPKGAGLPRNANGVRFVGKRNKPGAGDAPPNRRTSKRRDL